MINLYLLYLCIISGIFAICFMVVAFTYVNEVFKEEIKLVHMKKKGADENGAGCIDSDDNVDDSICR